MRKEVKKLKNYLGCTVRDIERQIHKQGLALSSQPLHENQYDAHTLNSSLKKSEAIKQIAIKQDFVGNGYKGHEVEGTQI